MRMLCYVWGNTREDKIKSENIRESIVVAYIVENKVENSLSDLIM